MARHRFVVLGCARLSTTHNADFAAGGAHRAATSRAADATPDMGAQTGQERFVGSLFLLDDGGSEWYRGTRFQLTVGQAVQCAHAQSPVHSGEDHGLEAPTWTRQITRAK
jgi:hypothetical protein